MSSPETISIEQLLTLPRYLGLAAVDRVEVDEEAEGGKYLFEVRDQIRGDVVMERALVGWNRPIVSVVKDRGVVLQELRDGLEGYAPVGKHECLFDCECMWTPERVAK